MTRLILPLCSYLPHSTAPTPVSSVTTIIDLQGVTLRSIWMLRNHLQQASTLATANYPETLNTIAVVNSPPFFPTIWEWIKVRSALYHLTPPITDDDCGQNWFDEGTRTKIHVLGHDPGAILRALVDKENLPKPYGGELDWTFQDEPNLDADAKGVIGEMPKGPFIFVDGMVVRP
jgi:hypothetical protein